LADSVALVISLSASEESANIEPAADASRARPVIALAAQSTALLGSLPRAGLGFGGALAAEQMASLRFELRGSYYIPQSTTFEPGEPGAHFRLFVFGVRGCRTWRLGDIDLAPCVGADVQRLSASGFGGSVRQQGGATSWGPAFGGLGRMRLSNLFGIYVAVEAVVPIVRRRFIYADVGELHRAAPIALQLMLAPEVRF
jgi:hypothetical protein